ncbi:GNAT family N-acetyltransferase [Deinococcus misasensis]|uniref:GNAT family N-acetyltransferase n=1 Tax=Deinococcus misasensis TaxID=392413 RepID=UPI000554E3C0|nr:GNAT family N-acetyltransferase [Deinococcus misasensis]
MSDITVRNQQDKQRYEAILNGEVVGFAEYRPLQQAVMFTHTEVNPGLEGQGIASTLIQTALKETQQAGKWVIPMCPFVVGYIQKHPEHLSAVNPQHRSIFGI